MTNTIYVDNNNQKVLMECELKGQISDGYWENASPRGHYLAPCRAEVVVTSKEEAGINFFTDRKYDFTSYNLLKWVGERMINLVKLSMLFPNANNEMLRHMSDPDYIAQEWNNPDKYFVDKKERITQTFNVHTVEDIALLTIELDKVSYTKKDLKKDLTRLKEIFSAAVY